MIRRAARAGLVLIVLAPACGGGSPTTPTPPSTPQPAVTRILRLEANLDFGPVNLGDTVTRGLKLINDGNAAITVTSITGPTGGAFTSSFTAGTIAPGVTIDATIRFTPATVRAYNGTLTVNANHTGGTNTIPITASGFAPIWTHAGMGNSVFDMPSYVNRVRITGTSTSNCQNFAVRRNGSLVINTIIGTCSVADVPAYDGTHLVTGGGVIEIVISERIAWTFTEIR